MSKKKRPEIVLVSWIDSHSTHGWLADNEFDHRAAPCESVGYLVRETKRTLTLAQSRAMQAGQLPWGELITIPKVAIIKRQILKP